MNTLREIWNYPLIPPVPWPYVLCAIGVVLIVGAIAIYRILEK